jgi:hypothetical protein
MPDKATAFGNKTKEGLSLVVLHAWCDLFHSLVASRWTGIGHPTFKPM